MAHRKNLLRALVPCLLIAVGLIVFAPAAEAEDFRIEGKTFKELELKEEAFAEEATSTMSISSAGLGSIINCTARAVDQPVSRLLWFNFIGGRTHRRVLLTMCTVLDRTTGAELPCTVSEPVEWLELGNLIFPTPIRLFETYKPSTEGGAFGVVKLKGEKCVLPTELKLTGTYAAEMETGERVEQSLTFNAEAEKLGETAFFIGGKAATITGKTKARLSGANKGKKWGYE